ncbi:MAG: hypothetical protein RLZZ312_517 [Bacteroidota bacterium]|jgi:hypothetical protein
MRNFLLITILSSILLSIGCARRGNIGGGLKDSLAPKLISSLPRNLSTNFEGNEIQLFFNEYVKLKDLTKQLVVSPPMNTPPDISPQVASKFLKIRIKDTLKPNTTYSLNFGDCIRDNNEDNVLSQFKFVFSTGSSIDTLSVSGTIKDALEKKPENFVSVMLYEINEKYNDSTVYKQKPRYVTNTLDSLKTWKIENVKAGKYALIALKDANNNFKFDSKSEKIGFYQSQITVPSSQQYELILFKEAAVYNPKKVFQASGNRAVFAHEGDARGSTIILKNGAQVLKTIVTKFPEKDSLQVWFEKIKVDSLVLNVTNNKSVKNFAFKIKDQKKDTLNIQCSPVGSLPFRSDVEIKTSLPIVAFDKTKFLLLSKDSTAVKFDIQEDQYNQALKILFKKEENETYKLKIAPMAMTDFLGNSNKKLLVFRLETKSKTDYGNINITLTNYDKFPAIIELTDSLGKVIASAYSEKSPKISFDLLEPVDNIFIRIIHDANRNKKWDSGNVLLKQQPEAVYYYKTATKIDIRANWDVMQSVDLR